MKSKLTVISAFAGLLALGLSSCTAYVDRGPVRTTGAATTTTTAADPWTGTTTRRTTTTQY
jgi:hypothetical protein